ncbi:MAG: hypothetical protein ACJ74Z_19960 [Bryobacteraceae bacterium]|jgi:hypothetical protein
MPFIKPEDSTPLVDFKCKLRADELEELRAYAAAISSSESYVISQAIKRLTTDKAFREWKSANQDKLSLGSDANPKAKRGPKAKAGAVSISEREVA